MAQLTQNTKLRKRRTVFDVIIPQSMLSDGGEGMKGCGVAAIQFLSARRRTAAAAAAALVTSFLNLSAYGDHMVTCFGEENRTGFTSFLLRGSHHHTNTPLLQREKNPQ